MRCLTGKADMRWTHATAVVNLESIALGDDPGPPAPRRYYSQLEHRTERNLRRTFLAVDATGPARASITVACASARMWIYSVAISAAARSAAMCRARVAASYQRQRSQSSRRDSSWFARRTRMRRGSSTCRHCREASVPLGIYGNAGRGLIYGPGEVNFDLAILRYVNIRPDLREARHGRPGHERRFGRHRRDRLSQKPQGRASAGRTSPPTPLVSLLPDGKPAIGAWPAPSRRPWISSLRTSSNATMRPALTTVSFEGVRGETL